jgi:hypothetical protein
MYWRDPKRRRKDAAKKLVHKGPATKPRTATASYTGTLPTFLAAGFEEVARRSPKSRVVVRR